MNKKAMTVFVLTVLFATSAYASSVSATGVVDSVYTSGGVKHLKIVRPDSTTLDATCDGSSILYECNQATQGMSAWGRATCTGGYCSWSCLDVYTTCGGGTTTLGLNGTVVSKETCAGEMYLTILASGSEIKARCIGSMWDDCDQYPLNQSVAAGIELTCSEAYWFYLIHP